LKRVSNQACADDSTSAVKASSRWRPSARESCQASFAAVGEKSSLPKNCPTVPIVAPKASISAK
jgi:hypothetical protein